MEKRKNFLFPPPNSANDAIQGGQNATHTSFTFWMTMRRFEHTHTHAHTPSRHRAYTSAIFKPTKALSKRLADILSLFFKSHLEAA